MNSLSKKYILKSLFILVLTVMCFTFSVLCYASGEACNHENTRTVEAKAATCTEKGYTDGIYCDDCEMFISGHIETDFAHNEIPYREILPTCVTTGYTEGVYCNLCETFLWGHEEVPVVPHTEIETDAVEPTCTAVGYTKGVFCTVCETYTSGHEERPFSHKEKLMPKQPETCTQNGYTAGIYCVLCETYLSGHEEIPASHKEVYVGEQPATCTGNGYTAGLYCTVCNEYFWGHVEIPFTDHDFSEKIVDERHLVHKATVESPAVYRYDCRTCSAMSPTLTFTDGERLPIGAISSIKAVQTTSAIKLTWSPVSGANGYRVYYYNPTEKKWKAVKDVIGTTVTFTNLKSGTVYKFAVKAFTVDGGKKLLAYDYTTTETATMAPATSKIVSKQTSSAIKLTWAAAKGATGYRIYYKSGNKWVACVKSTVDTSHTFTNLPAGKTYQFAIRSYTIMDAGLVLGEYNTYVAATVPKGVTVTAVSQAPKYVSVSWNAVSTDGYQLFYKTNNGSYKLYKVYTSAQKLMFSGLKSGTKYTFVVRTVKKTSAGYLYGEYTPVSVTVR